MFCFYFMFVFHKELCFVFKINNLKNSLQKEKHLQEIGGCHTSMGTDMYFVDTKIRLDCIVFKFNTFPGGAGELVKFGRSAARLFLLQQVVK